MPRDPHIPPGWDANPSSWAGRVPLVGMALTAFAIAVYLTLWQYEVIEDIWEPFFGDGSRIILASELSFPFEAAGFDLPFRISDGLLGAIAYLLEATTGAIGGQNRWWRRPWVVLAFVTLVCAVGLVGVALTVAQPLIYGQWCTLCLVTAVIVVVMMAPALREALATLQYLKRIRHTPGQSTWRALWGVKFEI